MTDDRRLTTRHLRLFVDTTPRPGWQNMAIDRALLDLAVREGAVYLRLYRWAPHCLSFGRHEPAARRYGRDRIEAMGLDCVRRPTGGRAVWHARELTYAVAAPEALGPLRSIYLEVHGMLAGALRILGADPALATPGNRAPGPAAGACFAAPVGGELMVQGRKVAGSAQVRTAGGLLQHGSLLLEDDQRLVHELTGTVPDPPPEAPLSQLMGRTVQFAEAVRAVLVAAGAWGGWRPAPAEQILLAAGAWTDRFRAPDWTWQR